MNDRYLYRAKRIDNGEWVKGPYVDTPTENEDFLCVGTHEYSSYMITQRGYITEVDSSTICQCIGLDDKNGKSIFNNDIVKLHDRNIGYTWRAILRFGDPKRECTWGWRLEPIGECKTNKDIFDWIGREESGVFCEIIGNVFDNPELLEARK